MEYECPKCGKEVMLIEVNSKHFKYRIICRNCVFDDWVNELIELKEIKWEKSQNWL